MQPFLTPPCSLAQTSPLPAALHWAAYEEVRLGWGQARVKSSRNTFILLVLIWGIYPTLWLTESVFLSASSPARSLLYPSCRVPLLWTTPLCLASGTGFQWAHQLQ